MHTPKNIQALAKMAEDAMCLAIPRRSKFPVGCAIASAYNPGKIWIGANFETQWQTSIHAEKTAILAMLMDGVPKFDVLCIAAEREIFTPCGDCMDHVIEFGGKHAIIYHYRPSKKDVRKFTAKQLMPYYPTRESDMR